jgi:hypothetical protein
MPAHLLGSATESCLGDGAGVSHELLALRSASHDSWTRPHGHGLRGSVMSDHRERLARDFAAWLETTSLREIEMVVGLIAGDLFRRGLPGTRALYDAQRAIEQFRHRPGQG